MFNEIKTFAQERINDIIIIRTSVKYLKSSIITMSEKKIKNLINI